MAEHVREPVLGQGAPTTPPRTVPVVSPGAATGACVLLRGG